MSPEEEKGFPLEEEYKKNTQITRQDIAKLRQWLETQPHLPADAITENKTTVFICESPKHNSGCTMHYFLGLSIPLETRAHDGSKILYGRLLDYDAKNFVFIDSIRAFTMVIDILQYNEGTWPGLVMVIDLDQVNLSFLARLDLQVLHQYLYYVQEAMLVKLKGVHFLGAPSFMERLMMILRPFMKKELMDLMTIHQAGSNTIGKFLPIEALPTNFENARDEMLSTVRDGADYFIAENKKRVTESKRPGKPKTITDIFGGIEGSFKQLDID